MIIAVVALGECEWVAVEQRGTHRPTPCGYNAAHDTARTAIMCARRLHSVFVVIAALLLRQDMFVIAEHHPVARVGDMGPLRS
jgi:hypothetical protein